MCTSKIHDTDIAKKICFDEKNNLIQSRVKFTDINIGLMFAPEAKEKCQSGFEGVQLYNVHV